MGDIAKELLGAALGVLATGAASFFLHRVAITKARRLWRLRQPKGLSIVLSTSARVSTGTYDRPVTGLGPARALGLVAPSLVTAYRTLSENAVTLSEFCDDRAREGDLILLGGPKNNAVTREALARLDRKLPITMKTVKDERILRRTDSGDELVQPASTPSPSFGRSGADYGFILRAPNCFDSSGTLTIFAGTHTYGTVAAARYFLDNAKEMRKLTKQKRFVILIRARVTAGEHVEHAEVYLGPTPF